MKWNQKNTYIKVEEFKIHRPFIGKHTTLLLSETTMKQYKFIGTAKITFRILGKEGGAHNKLHNHHHQQQQKRSDNANRL